MIKSINGRFMLALFIALILILSQFLFRYESMGGVECLKSLSTPKPNKRQVTDFSTSYGFPVTFLTAHTSGCFEEQITRYNFEPIGLLADILFIVVLATAPYWLQAIRRRFLARIG